MDSELVVNQMLGKYRVKAVNLLPFYERARELLSCFPKAKIVHAPREHPSIQPSRLPGQSGTGHDGIGPEDKEEMIVALGVKF